VSKRMRASAFRHAAFICPAKGPWLNINLPPPEPMDAAKIASALKLHDPAFRRRAPEERALWRKRLGSEPFSKSSFEQAQVAGDIRLFKRTPTPIWSRHRTASAADLLAQLLERCESERPIRVLLTRKDAFDERAWRPQTILKRWKANSHPFGVIDLPTGRSDVARIFDWQKFARPNLLSARSPRLRRFELCGPIVSTSGHITSAHVDDPDIWNTCAVGAKVWFMWDLGESIATVGDPRKTDVRFQLSWFAKLKSSRWAVVGAGAALYVPNNFVHRVVTIESYVGASSFFVSALSAPRQIRHWKRFGATWALSGDEPQFVSAVERLSRARTS